MADPITEKLAEKVRELRQKKGLTQAQLAEAVDVTNETISRLERGAYEPALSTAVSVAKTLGINLTDLTAAPEKVSAVSPVLRRITQQLSRLDGRAHSAILSVVELLAERTALEEIELPRAAEPEGKYPGPPSKRRR
jgi:DNA-binding XRE family transcriptional regulator